MSIYHNILVAIDISNEAEIVLSRSLALAKVFDAKLTLTHIVEPVVTESDYSLNPTINLDLEPVLVERANDFLRQMTAKKHVDDVKTIVTVGSPKHEIHRICQEKNCDLVIVGTHGRHGFSLLLGNTANAVLHGTKCDVLAVKV